MRLSQRRYTEKKPNLDRDERLYGTITWSPFENTTISVQGETMHRRSRQKMATGEPRVIVMTFGVDF